MTTPSKPDDAPSPGALPPMPSSGPVADPIVQADDDVHSIPVEAPVLTPAHTTTMPSALRRASVAAVAVAFVVAVALIAFALVFLGRGGSGDEVLVPREVEPVVLDLEAGRNARGVVGFGAPALVADGQDALAEVWEITVQPPRVATDEARSHRDGNEPMRNHEFVAVSVTIKLVASALGSEFPPGNWLIEGFDPFGDIELPSIPRIETCSLPNNFVAVPVAVGETIEGTFCAEVEDSRIADLLTVRLQLAGGPIRFTGG